MSEHTYHARDCRTPVEPAKLMCWPHWKMVPRNLQAAVWATCRPGQEVTKTPAREYLDAAQDAIDAVAAIERPR